MGETKPRTGRTRVSKASEVVSKKAEEVLPKTTGRSRVSKADDVVKKVEAETRSAVSASTRVRPQSKADEIGRKIESEVVKPQFRLSKMPCHIQKSQHSVPSPCVHNQCVCPKAIFLHLLSCFISPFPISRLIPIFFCDCPLPFILCDEVRWSDCRIRNQKFQVFFKLKRSQNFYQITELNSVPSFKIHDTPQRNSRFIC